MKKYPQVAAGKFKAECLELLDRVANEGNTYVVTKRGKPVAKVCPVDKPKLKSMRGSVIILGDIVGPIEEDWPLDDDQPDLYDGLDVISNKPKTRKKP
ncbi:MAG: type II toxin-antitoxin system Phd/YefM family antitoxin [Polyangiaceae bacterium]